MTATTNVLFDTLGPRASRRSLIASVVIGVTVATILSVVLYRLVQAGQFTEAKLGPFFNPTNEDFMVTWQFLGHGLLNTLIVATLALVLSLAAGTFLAVCRVSAAPWYRWIIVTVIEVLRAVPVVLLIYAVSRILPVINAPLSLMWYLIIGIVLYSSVAIAEIIRSGISALPKGQTEAALSLGLSNFDLLRLVVLPQAFKLMLPALISQLVIVLKETSLGFVISFEELLRRGQMAIQTLHNPLQMYFVIGLIYVIINLAITRIAREAESRILNKTHRSKKGFRRASQVPSMNVSEHVS
ncbi:amino acid ABC transporter permease [Cryobacterium sp. TMT1-2-2]|uniref:amino acid ABC transporter permease n=1 Tax=Cryobacterium sp. TMT1-2-2 TaxID=1259233 RepID=UPI00106C4BE3|nr:amino acid ABC transporter permease [Cryobacterium sp. TMT1-2-2]TFD15329.1 amino acid ABC transporter permease [Cryobacterium sp. TMT1-2-2]